MKNLLAIINDQKNAKPFIEYAANLASNIDANLKLLTVFDPQAYPLGMPNTTGTATVLVQQQLEELAEKAKRELKKVSEEVNEKLPKKLAIEVLSEVGTAKIIVEELIAKDKIQMVIVESTKDDDLLIQSGTNIHFIYTIDCPVWVIPSDTAYEPFNKIVYATDYKEEDITTLKRLLKLTGSFNPQIVALHITDTNDFEERVKTSGFLNSVRKATGYDKIEVKALLEREDDNAAELISDYSADIDADLVVVLKKNRSFLERIFKSSSTKKLIKEAKTPVLIYHEKES